MAFLGSQSTALRRIPDHELLDSWVATVEAFSDPRSPESRALRPALGPSIGLSPGGLEAALGAILGGVGKLPARDMIRRAGAFPKDPRKPALVFLAGNLPALAVQPLLPALALRRPVLLKSPSSEPRFTPAFVAALARRLPAAANAMAVLRWEGGDVRIEAPLLAGAGKVLAYGDSDSIADLRSRSPAPVLGYGPRISLAVLGAGIDPETVAEGLARDIALFDQRGCLSIHGIFTLGDPEALARALEVALEELAARWPPGPARLEDQAAARQEIETAHLQGLRVFELPLGHGAVLIDPEARLKISPGLRIVRIFPVADLETLPQRLAPWQDRLQGVAMANADSLLSALKALGASRIAPPGKLQHPDAAWHNGGISPLEALG